jgi:predicted deacetylase
MNWAVWRSVEQALLELDVKPIVAVVPDNQDAALKVGEENKNFWDDVRAWQERGWTIGLHGYQHVYATEVGHPLRPRGRIAKLFRAY